MPKPNNPKQPAWSFGPIPGFPVTKSKDGETIPAPVTDEEKLKRIISETFGIDENELTPNVHLVHDLDMDSLDLVELAIVVEEEFDFEFNEDEPVEEFVSLHRWLLATAAHKP